MTKIPALTIYNPWGMLIMLGIKPFETRGYPPPSKFIGGLLGVHAGKSRAAWPRLPEKDRGAIGRRLEAYDVSSDPAQWTYGAMLGTVRLIGAIQLGRRAEGRFGPVVEVANQIGDITHHHRVIDGWLQEDRYGDYSPGRWAWALSSPSAYPEPVPARGKQGFWYWEKPE